MRYWNWIMVAIYFFLLVASIDGMIEHGGDAWFLAASGWFCATTCRVILAIEEQRA